MRFGYLLHLRAGSNKPLLLSSFFIACTVKPVLSGYSKIDKTKVLKLCDSLMQVKVLQNAPLLTCIKRLLFLCPQRNFGRHIVIALSVRVSVRVSVPLSCPVHISYIL